MSDYAVGGLIPKSETVKVRLCNGYVIAAPEIVARYGEEFMAKLNEMNIPEFSIRGEDA